MSFEYYAFTSENDVFSWDDASVTFATVVGSTNFASQFFSLENRALGKSKWKLGLGYFVDQSSNVL